VVHDANEYDGRMDANRESMKRCTRCSREFDDSFIYCPFCGKQISLPDAPKRKWYYSTRGVVLGIVFLGPFALPAVWFNPRYGILTKTIITILVLALTVLVGYPLVMLYVRMTEQVRQLITPY
jgi:DNA-directed RNA polymerase subunit RPC12/RpoP